MPTAVRSRGKVRRLVSVTKSIGDPAAPSRQIGKGDQFKDADYHELGLVEPPFAPEQLLWLAESHPVHGSCIQQSAIDTVGGGWKFEPKNPKVPKPEHESHTPATAGDASNRGRKPMDDMVTDPSPKTNGAGARVKSEQILKLLETEDPAPTPVEGEEWKPLDEKFRKLAPPGTTMVETLQKWVEDRNKHGYGAIEIVRDLNGKVAKLYNVPAHTLRAHSDGVRWCQQRGEKKVWFSEWGSGKRVKLESGDLAGEDAKGEEVGSELLIIRASTSRTDYYGIPEHVAAIGWIVLALAARDYNIQFFRNHREPRWAVIISNLDPAEEGEEKVDAEIEQAFSTDLVDPHRNLIATFEGEVKVEFKKLSEDQNDASFLKLLDTCNDHVLVAHRMPSGRVGWIRVGPLGGSSAETENRVYQEGVINPLQEVLNFTITNFIHKELGGEEWLFKLNELDSRAERSDLEGAIKGFRAGIFTIDEARIKSGQKPVGDPMGNKFIWELDPDAARSIKQLFQEDPPAQVNTASIEDMLKWVVAKISSMEEAAAEKPAEKPAEPVAAQ